VAAWDEDAIPNELLTELILRIDEEEGPGAVLVFLPGWGEISDLHQGLSQLPQVCLGRREGGSQAREGCGGAHEEGRGENAVVTVSVCRKPDAGHRLHIISLISLTAQQTNTTQCDAPHDDAGGALAAVSVALPAAHGPAAGDLQPPAPRPPQGALVRCGYGMDWWVCCCWCCCCWCWWW
jgi:hypothetical protein